MIEKFKRSLQTNSVDILDENNIEGIVELLVDKIPGKKILQTGCMREDLYDFEPFFIKSHDAGKLGGSLTPLGELRQEIEVCRDFVDEKILIVEKIAILHLKDSNKVFLVEKKIEPFNEEKWKKNGLYEEALGLCTLAKRIFLEVGDFKLENLGYDKEDNKLKFFDVFPKQN